MASGRESCTENLLRYAVRMNESIHEIVEKKTKFKTVPSLHLRLQKLPSQ